MSSVSREVSASKVQQAYLAMRGWNFGRVLARLKEEGYNDAEEMQEEYIRFMALVVGERGSFPISRGVDPFWHNHLLFTRDYHQFSLQVSPDRFLHHNPVGSEEERLGLKAEYDGFREKYEIHFGKPSLKFWADADMVCKCCSPCSCDIIPPDRDESEDSEDPIDGPMMR